MFPFSVIYYSNADLSHPLYRFCLETLARAAMAAGGELVCVTWEPLYRGAPEARNVVWPVHTESHRNIYEQILAGISEARSETVLLAEHDVLYPAGYHDEMTEASKTGLCYNTNILCLNHVGFFRPDYCHLLSNCGGPRSAMTAGIAGKLEEIRTSGRVIWAEPPGHSEVHSVHPTVDIRHGSNFTGHRETSPRRYAASDPYWGNARDYTCLFPPSE